MLNSKYCWAFHINFKKMLYRWLVCLSNYCLLPFLKSFHISSCKCLLRMVTHPKNNGKKSHKPEQEGPSGWWRPSILPRLLSVPLWTLDNTLFVYMGVCVYVCLCIQMYKFSHHAYLLGCQIKAPSKTFSTKDRNNFEHCGGNSKEA